MNSDKVKYWIELAEYDLVTAEVMLTGSRYLYVGYMCHQAIEKILKAYYTSILEKTPPHTHNLTNLCKQSGLFEKLDDKQKDFLFTVQPLNIEARYPSYKENLLKSLNNKNCSEILINTKEFLAWVKQIL